MWTTVVESNDLRAYGLDDPVILGQAVERAPQVFAALWIAKTLPGDRYPLETDEAIEAAMDAIVTDGDRFLFPGVTISRSDARDLFPHEFLPVIDAADLVRKVSLAIIISHQAERTRVLARIADGTLQPKASHPLPEEIA